MIRWFMISICIITAISFIVYMFDRSGNYNPLLSIKLMEVVLYVFVLLYFLNLFLGWGWSLI